MRAALTALLSICLAIPALAGPVPDFTLKKLDGSAFRMADVRGKQVVLVDFWATWCAPCVKYLKKLQELKERYPDVLVVTVSIDDSSSQSKVAQLVQGKGYDFMVLLDPDTSVCRMFNPQAGVPYTMIIDRKGELAYSHAGYLPGQEKELARRIEELRK